MFTFSSTGPYSKEQIKLLKEMEEKCNLLMKLDKDLFNQKYSHLINFFTPVMWLDIKKRKVVLDLNKTDNSLTQRLIHVSQHLANVGVYTHNKPDLIKWFDCMDVIQNKMTDWPECRAKLALRNSSHVRSKTDSKIVEDFIDCYEKSTKLWKQMESQFLVESAYMLPSNGAFIKKKVPPDTENTENNQYMEEVGTQYKKFHSAYIVFVENEGIRELTQSNQLSRLDRYALRSH